MYFLGEVLQGSPNIMMIEQVKDRWMTTADPQSSRKNLEKKNLRIQSDPIFDCKRSEDVQLILSLRK